VPDELAEASSSMIVGNEPTVNASMTAIWSANASGDEPGTSDPVAGGA
jgi:hypothetical protein